MEKQQKLNCFSVKNGFTLLELLVVLVLISLMVALVVPRFTSSLTRLESRTVSLKIAAGLRYARSRAISEKRVYVAKIDFENQLIQVFPLSTPPREFNFHEDVQGDFDFYPIPQHIRLIWGKTAKGDVFREEPFIFLFFPTGGSSGGDLLLRDNKHRKILISVDFITGTVKLIQDGIEEM